MLYCVTGRENFVYVYFILFGCASLDKAPKQKNTCLPHAFVRKLLFSFSWYIFNDRLILLKLQKWLPLRVRVIS